MAFGLNIKKRPRKEVQETVEEVMEMVGLTAFADMLSPPAFRQHAAAGGPSPGPLPWSRSLLLMDEPYGQLDIDAALQIGGRTASAVEEPRAPR